jgi:hypothetical protein
VAASQFTIAVYNKLWDLLEAHAAFIGEVRVGNRIDWTTGQAQVKKYGVPQKAPADYPQITLDLGDAEDTLATISANYGMRNPAQTAANTVWTERFRQDYTLEIACEDKRLTQSELLLMEGLTALRKGIPKLGFAYVQQYGPCSVARATEAEDETGRKLLRVARISIPVVCQFNGADLLT